MEEEGVKGGEGKGKKGLIRVGKRERSNVERRAADGEGGEGGEERKRRA
jgi:hypothetical protein